MRKKASSQDCLFHTDSVCFMASRHLISLCSSYTTFIFFSVIWSTVRVSSLLHKKRENSRLQPSGLPNWTASHLSFMPLYVDQGSGTKLFLLPDNIKAICFVLWNVRSTGEIAKRAHNCDVGERHEQQTEEEREPQRHHVGKKKN